MTQLNHSATADDVLVWEHGRRLGIAGDGQTGSPSVLVLDGKAVPRIRGLFPATGGSGAGAVTLAAAVVGDIVLSVTDTNSSPFVDVTANFEAVISVVGQIQQKTTVSGHGILVLLGAQSAS